MIYKITYRYANNMYTHTCYSLREADTFFDILLAIKCDYIKIITFTKQNVK